MNWLRQDALYGLRTIWKDRAFFLTAVLALALGIVISLVVEWHGGAAYTEGSR